MENKKMKKLIKNTILVVVFLGLFLVGCEKSNVEPVVPEVVTPAEPEEEKFLQTAFRLKVYYTKLNLVDTTYMKRGNFESRIEVEAKVVPQGDISVSNFREGKYDLVDSTDYYSYQSAFKYGYNYSEKANGYLIDNSSLFYGLHKEGYIHKVVVEMSNVSGIDKNYSRMDMVNKTVFLREFERWTYVYFRKNFLKSLRNGVFNPFYYIKDLIDEPVDTDMYIEFKDVPYYK